MKRYILLLLNLKAIIFGLVLLHVMAMQVYVMRTEQRLSALEHQGFALSDHWNPMGIMVEPLVLLVASLGLVINRSWSYTVALMASGTIIHWLGYGGLRGVSSAHDLPLLSFEVCKRWFLMTYAAQPQYLYELGLSAIIMMYSTVVLWRSLSRRLAGVPLGI
jgi:hypothetical protein